MNLTEQSKPFIIAVRSAVCGVDDGGNPEVIEDAAILVRDGSISDIGERTRILAGNLDIRIVENRNCVAIPGLINAHHHSGLTPLQLGVPFAPLELWLPRFMGMRSVDPRLDTLYSAVEMLESGTTTVHHIQGGTYGDPETWDAPADAIISAYGEIGMRACYSFMIRDQNQLVFDDDDVFLATLPSELSDHFAPRLKAGRAPVSRMMDFFIATKKRWEERAPGTVRLQMAPANLHWCSDAALVEIFGLARDQGAKLHMHLDETRLQADYARQRTGKSAVRHLADLGCLGPDLTIGHGIWADAGDLDLLESYECCLCHNASSGLRLASGIAPINAARSRDMRIALGIDQSGVNDDRDMLQEMRVAWMIHRVPGLFQDRPKISEIFQMATEHGAQTTGFGSQIGRLDAGCQADIVLIDWPSIAEPYLDDRTPLLDALIHRAKSRSVEKVYVAGKMVVDGGHVCTIDRDALMNDIRESLNRDLSSEERTAAQMTDALIPYVETYYRARGYGSDTQSYLFNKNDV